jgi:Ca-activated chloride channel family protein
LIYIHGFWIVAALVVFLWWAFARKRALLARFAQIEMLRRMMAHVSLRAQHVKAILVVLALVALVLALMQPQWGYTWEDIERRGIDVIVAVDVSRSMLANDIRPSRLDRAKRSILDLLNLMQGDRIGLIAFAGSAFVQCPLTLDYGACKMFVDELEPELIPRGGTRIGDAIRKAVDAFEGDVKKHRALILITDGEDHQGDALAAAELAKEKGVRIYCIGIGTPEGSPIQVTDEQGNSSYLKSRDGQVVLSKLDEDTLKRIALTTGGAYVPASSSGLELDEIYSKRIARMEEKDLASTRRKRYEHRFQWPLGLALVLIIIEALSDDRIRSPKTVPGQVS